MSYRSLNNLQVGRHVYTSRGLGKITALEKREEISHPYVEKFPFGTRFASVSFDKGGAAYVPVSDIQVLEEEEIKTFREKEYEDCVKLAKDLALLKPKFFSHETNRKNLSSILNAGLDPRYAERGLRSVGGKYVMFSSSESTDFHDLQRSGGGVGKEDSVFIVFRPSGMEQSILIDLLESKELSHNLIDHVKDWYISKETIPSSSFLMVYDNKGKIIWRSRK